MFIKTIKFLYDHKRIQENTVIDLSGTDNYCALVGLNGSGKTSVIDYLHLNLFNCCNSLYSTFKDQYTILFEKTNLYNKPKYVFYNYSGESLIGTRSSGDIINMFNFDSSMWNFACFVFQLINDPIIVDYHLKSQKIEEWMIKAYKKYKNHDDKEYKILEYIFDKIAFLTIQTYDIEKMSNMKDILRHTVKMYIQDTLRHDSKPGIILDDNSNLLSSLYRNIYTLSEGQKKLLVLKLIMYLADENSLVLLDEPDANLDIQKKRELFEMIKYCPGQVILTTHDPILTKWMKGHLIFMKDGKQIPSDIVNAINEISEGEISYQETMLMLSECKHFVFVEGKTDIAFIKKAIEKLGYSKQFENITFLSLGSSGAVEDKYYTTIAELLPKDTKKVLFLFDADNGGSEGKKQIDNIIKEYNDIENTKSKLNKKNTDLENITDEKVKYEIRIEIKELKDKIERIKKGSFNPNTLLSYYFYNKNDNFSAKQDDDKMKWFYLEDYFKVDTYPDEYKVRKKDIKNSFKDFLPENDSENDDILKFRELEAFGQRCKNQKFSSYATKIKEYFKEKLYLIDKVNDFELFRPLLEKILEKLELKNES